MTRADKLAKLRQKYKSKPQPHLAAALLCETVLEDKDGVMSAIRIVDVIKVPPETLDVKGSEQSATILTGLISFKSGKAKGEYVVEVATIDPTGRLLGKIPPITVSFLGDGHGVNVKITFFVPIKTEGLYWYDVLVDGKRVTRIPLQIVHVSRDAGSSPQSKTTKRQR